MRGLLEGRDMKREIKAEWLKALRSGEYEQIAGILKGRDAKTGKVGYCCLGVLCDVVDPEGFEDEREGVFRHRSYDGLPGEFVDLKAGNDYKTIVIPALPEDQRDFYELTELNDSGDFTFDQIADLIEYFIPEG